MPLTPSPLRYPGGKTKIYKFVRSVIEVNGLIGETYIEPFAGGAGLALKLLMNNDVKRIVINDFDPAIYSFWYCVLNNTRDICDFIKRIPLSIEEWDNQHKIYINKDNYSQLELAQATLYLNRTNISGVIKGGAIGGRNQTGNYKINARFNREELINKIQNVAKLKDKIDVYNLYAIDFIKNDVLGHYYKVLINFDPPYVQKGGQLYKNSFSKDDHRILRDHIAKCKRKWMVTYDVCDLVSELYSEFRGDTIDIYYTANGVKRAKEYIYFSDNLIIP